MVVTSTALFIQIKNEAPGCKIGSNLEPLACLCSVSSMVSYHSNRADMGEIHPFTKTDTKVSVLTLDLGIASSQKIIWTTIVRR